MQTTRAALTDMVETRPQKKDIDGLSNAAAVQIFSGLSCITLQVFLLVNYHDADESIQHNGNTIFTLAVGSFGFLAGIFGCFASGSRKWINYAYLVTSLGVVGSSVLYFLAGYWDFYNAVKDSGKLYYLTVNNRTEAIQPTLPVDDELHFWFRAGLFLCVIVLALFSLAGMAVVASYRICNGGWTKKDDYKSLLAQQE
ncbi:uncharacterized protein LOC124342277 isoform X1 [Daphnia pulicaria]|uniref:uncharacterized protein LOC124342277 isoform X1 n=1 Tax=Daphnia pulicaria TaxID=35523 RepID=UPI001EEA0D8B|nr:uncharacterized protein LOC124342277 isoform X1 [Daphnia pulicaria]